MSDDYSRTDAERDDDRAAMADEHSDALETCVVCGEHACMYDDDCIYKLGRRVGGHVAHEGGCLELYRESQATMAALAVAVGR